MSKKDKGKYDELKEIALAIAVTDLVTAIVELLAAIVSLFD